jgi:hypothetical protein
MLTPSKGSKSVAAGRTHPMYVDNPHFDPQSTDPLAKDSTVTREQFFAQLRAVLSHGLADGVEKVDNLARLDLLTQAEGYTFLKHYSSFIAGAAKHMNVLCPYVPGLTSIMVRT